MKRFRITKLSSESGQSSVEFALVLPLVIAFLLVLVQMGFIFNFWIDTTHLASAGARYAAVNHVPGDKTLDEYLAGKLDLAVGKNHFTPKDPLTVCYELPDGDSVGDPITIRVSDTYEFGSVLKDLGMNGVTIKSSATERMEAVPDADMLPPEC